MTTWALTWAQVTPKSTTTSSAQLCGCVCFTVCRVTLEPAVNPQPFMARGWPAEWGWLWIKHREREGKKTVFAGICQSRGISFFCIAEKLQANPQGSRRFSGFFLFFCSLSESDRGLSAAFELFVFRIKGRGREGALDSSVDTWHTIGDPSETTKTRCAKMTRQTTTCFGRNKTEQQQLQKWRREVNKKKKGGTEETSVFVWTDSGSFPKGNRSRRETLAAKRKDQRIFYFFLAGQGCLKKMPFSLHFGLSLEVKVTQRREEKFQEEKVASMNVTRNSKQPKCKQIEGVCFVRTKCSRSTLFLLSRESEEQLRTTSQRKNGKAAVFPLSLPSPSHSFLFKFSFPGPLRCK